MDINPVIDIRKALGMTREVLASQAHCALTTVEYVEKGAYGPIPEAMEEILSIVDPDIQRSFTRWKISERLKQSVLTHSISGTFPELEDVMHPHQEWRQVVNDLGLNAYCEAIKIQRAIVQNLETGKQLRFPKPLHIALIHACGVDVADRLKRASDSYVEYKAGTNTGRISVC